MVVVAQLVRALVCGTRGRGFEPHLPPKEKSPARKCRVFFCRHPSSLLERIATKNIPNPGWAFFFEAPPQGSPRCQARQQPEGAIISANKFFQKNRTNKKLLYICTEIQISKCKTIQMRNFSAFGFWYYFFYSKRGGSVIV